VKALLGKLAKKIMNDPEGKKQLHEFISRSSRESGLIILSNGKKYKIYTSRTI
jgi:hypothetical protein